MKKKTTIGRPKMAKKDKKVGFCMTVNPELWKRLKPIKSRSAKIEAVLEKNF
jgi:DNA polymerase III delta prime subunit